MTEEEALSDEIIEYYNRILLESDASNTYLVRYMEYLKTRDPKYVPEGIDE